MWGGKAEEERLKVRSEGRMLEMAEEERWKVRSEGSKRWQRKRD